MSRNFDVLTKAGRESEIFETPTMRPATVAPEPPQKPIHIDPAVREEEMRMIQRIFLLENSHPPHVVLFCGIEPHGGTVGICARAGQNLADQINQPVCLVDANLADPSLHRYFGEKSIFGVPDTIVKPKAVCKFVRRIEQTNLFLLSAGLAIPDARSTLKSDRWYSMLSELRQQFSFVLISGPPAVRQVETVLLGRLSDGVVLVLESNQTRRETARTIQQMLSAANVNVLGAVLNNRTFPVPESIYRRF